MRSAGFVLVGGNSSRMGRDKARLPYRGRTLAAHIYRQVEEAAGTAFLVGPPGRYADLGLPIIPDLFSACGPLGGIHAALSNSSAEWNLVVACDMPNLTAPFLLTLLDEAGRRETQALVPVSPRGFPEPLCAVYNRSCAPVIAQAIEEGLRRTSAIFERLRTSFLPLAEDTWFHNMNTPHDWSGHLKKPHQKNLPVNAEDLDG